MSELDDRIDNFSKIVIDFVYECNSTYVPIFLSRLTWVSNLLIIQLGYKCY